jgi:Lrp/AsnC family leucine-responsive transcriptional regulator
MAYDSERLLDDVGWRIVEALQANARISYSDLGRQVGLSAPAVAERVRRLEEAGVITGYRAEVDPSKLGLPITALIRAAPAGELCARLTGVARELPEVRWCYRVTGDDACVMQVVAASVGHLERVIERLARYGAVSTSVVLSSLVPPRPIRRPDRDTRLTFQPTPS